MLLQVQSLMGLVAIPLIAWALSENRRAASRPGVMRLAAGAVVVQIAIAAVMLNVPIVRAAFEVPARVLEALQAATAAGMRITFGYLGGGPQPFDVVRPEATFVLALHALPLMLLVAVLSKLLYHWGILQGVVRGFAWALEKTLGITGPVGTSAAANVLLGMVEAPLLVKPYLARMSRAGLFATMTVGMAGIAGTVLAIYASVLGAKIPGIAGHLIVASVISVPAALLVAALMVPEADGAAAVPSGPGERDIACDAGSPRSSMDAIAQGTREGVDLVVSVAAMLIVAVALVALANMALGWAARPLGLDITIEKLLGYAMAPAAFLIGIPVSECLTAGALIGVKTVLNEFVAFLQLAALPEGALSARSQLVMAYGLSGFANLGSLGIMIGGLVAIAPERKDDIVSLAPATVVSGTLATLMTAAVVGLLTPG